MTRLLQLSSSRFLCRHPLQLLLAITGIALGVAVVVAVDLAKGSVLTAFDEAMRTVAGRATHRIVGGPSGLDESVYRQLRLSHGFIPMSPKVEGHVRLAGESRETLKIIGVDPFSEWAFQPRWHDFRNSRESAPDMVAFLTRPGALLLGERTARRLTVKMGDLLPLITADGSVEARLVGLLAPSDAVTRQSLTDLLLADIATAQEILGMIGRLSHIDLILQSAEEATALGTHLPPSAQMLEYGSGDKNVRQLTSAFYTNISALSLLSLVVGMFLIYNTLTFMVVQRRPLIGILRALGATRGEIFRIILGEAFMLGLAGTIIGLAVGTLLSHALLELIAKTVNEVFADLSTPPLDFSPVVLIKGAGLGIAATLLSALLPAREATAVPPLHALNRSPLEVAVRRRSLIGLAAGSATGFGGLMLARLSEQSVLVGFAALLCVVLGSALAAPAVTRGLMVFAAPILGAVFGVMGRLPPRSVNAGLSRTGIAIAALMVAVATTIGMEIMVDSFRRSLNQWLTDRINADFYVTAPAIGGSGAPTPLDDQLLHRIARLSGVAYAGGVRRVRLEGKAGTIDLYAYSLAPPARAGFRFREKSDGNVWDRLEKENAVIVSESYAFRHRISVDSTLSLTTRHGPRPFEVIGIYQDFNAGGGVVAMTRSVYRRHWSDSGLSAIWVYGETDADSAELRRAIFSTAPEGLSLTVTSNRSIVDTSLAIFDRAFTISAVLRWLAASIAFVGVFSALMALQLERTREFGILRAAGLTPAQLWRLVTAETGLMGLTAGLLAVPVGCAVAYMLIFVVNRRTFGWSMAAHVDLAILSHGAGLAVVAALLAGLYPAYRIARTSPAEAVRTE